MTRNRRRAMTWQEWAVLPAAVLISVPVRAGLYHDWQFPARLWWESLAYGVLTGLLLVFLFRFLRRSRR
ncbi:hypothetical protein [Amycolatopsis marina]|nr:hypothetical protein [Amycolatopsis marina]